MSLSYLLSSVSSLNSQQLDNVCGIGKRLERNKNRGKPKRALVKTSRWPWLWYRTPNESGRRGLPVPSRSRDKMVHWHQQKFSPQPPPPLPTTPPPAHPESNDIAPNPSLAIRLEWTIGYCTDEYLSNGNMARLDNESDIHLSNVCVPNWIDSSLRPSSDYFNHIQLCTVLTVAGLGSKSNDIMQSDILFTLVVGQSLPRRIVRIEWNEHNDITQIRQTV